MATVSDLRALGSTLTSVGNPIVEPLNAPPLFKQRLKRFGEHYDLSNKSHLYRYLVALCGDAGAGALKKELLVGRLQQQLEATHFLDLDRLYGDPLGLPRLSSEIYALDPQNEILTAAQWTEVYSKDAAYRARSLLWMRAIIAGPTPDGIKLAAQAAVGVDCDVFENYKYIEDSSSYANVAQTGSRNEFVVLPRTASTTVQENRRIMKLIDKLKPVNSLQTVDIGDDARVNQSVRNAASSSDKFYVSRLVTGRADIEWPALDLSKGYWIESGVEKEAPTFAFMDRQDSVTYLSIVDVTASSEHAGSFNKDQQALFAHLKNVPSPFYQFSATRSYAKNVAPPDLATVWLSRDANAPHDTVVVNNHYPLGYFADTNLGAFVQPPEETFWASDEQLPTNTEYLIFDFGRVRPINFIDFQICQKPINFAIEYWTGSAWAAVVPNPIRDVTQAATYLPSEVNPWYYFEILFALVQTQKIRITFTRRDEHFPLFESDPFPFSVEVREARMMHVIHTSDDFVADTGVDILGNGFRTTLNVYDVDNVLDNQPTFWQSQPNPSRHAVEALYFDLSLPGDTEGTMEALNTLDQSLLDPQSMLSVEGYDAYAQIIDEVYIDPITMGEDMHFYYSNDLTEEWDEKVWTPIPRSYVLKKGFHTLPLPTFAHFFKIEFSNLTAAPYQPIEYPEFPPFLYRRYPSWVVDYFNNVFADKPIEPARKDVVTDVVIDPLSFGFQTVDDKLVSNFEVERTKQITGTDTEVQDFISDVIEGTKPNLRSTVEDQINFRSPVQWQADLIAQLDPTRFLSRIAQAPREAFLDTGWTAELGIPIFTTPIQASTTSQEDAHAEKHKPTLWFPRRTRHRYQKLLAQFDKKLAFFVAIREVAFYRRDFSARVDDEVYYETLEDDAHIAHNDFIQNDWRFEIAL